MSITEKNINIHERIQCGSTLSTTSTSLEKRLTTLPVGVVSNNSMGHRNTKCNRMACISLDAYIQPKAIIRLAIRLVNAKQKCEIFSLFILDKFCSWNESNEIRWFKNDGVKGFIIYMNKIYISFSEGLLTGQYQYIVCVTHKARSFYFW